MVAFPAQNVCAFTFALGYGLQSFELAQRLKLEKTLATTEASLDAARAELLRLTTHVRLRQTYIRVHFDD